MILTIYVPATEDDLGIIPGSGIVGSPDGTRPTRAAPDGAPIIKIDYEGNRHHASNIVTFEDRLMHAAGRHVERYPTVARKWVEPDLVRAVGTYDTDTWSVVEITDKPALDAWVGRYGERP